MGRSRRMCLSSWKQGIFDVVDHVSSGGDAGHNGLRSITSHMGPNYRRIRLGIGHPGDKARVHSYVLGDFAKAEQGWVDALCDGVARNAGLLAKGDDSHFQSKVHLAMEAAGFGQVAPVTKGA